MEVFKTAVSVPLTFSWIKLLIALVPTLLVFGVRVDRHPLRNIPRGRHFVVAWYVFKFRPRALWK